LEAHIMEESLLVSSPFIKANEEVSDEA
jgi:hypothetical protein